MPRSPVDWRSLPVLLVPLLALAALPLIGSPTTWVTLTVAGLAMGMMIFVIASGLTLVFGLMDVLNFGHGAFIAVGAYRRHDGAAAAGRLDAGRRRSRSTSPRWGSPSLAAMVGTGALGWAFERVIILPVYGQHLKQILITMGGLIVAEQLIHVFWGGDQKPMPLPTGAARRHHRRRRRDREVPPARAWRSGSSSSSPCCSCSTAPRSAC